MFFSKKNLTNFAKRIRAMKMNILLTFLGTCTFFFSMAKADIELAGVYQGKNVYVQNPFTSNMKDYCTQDVYVNNQRLMSSIQSSAFEIDLSFLDVNDPVTIRITHKTDCNPKILNPQVVKVKTAFTFNSVNISDKSLSWAAMNEKLKGRFFVERFEFSRWRIIGEVYSNRSEYLLPIHHNSGLNKYRIKYLEDNGNIIYSDVLDYNSQLPELTFYPKRVTDNLYLSRETDFEILDYVGNIIRSGDKKEVDLSGLSSGVYYLNADNHTFKFFKK